MRTTERPAPWNPWLFDTANATRPISTPLTAPLSHQTVLLNEAIDALVSDPDGIYVDCTFGRGGHAAEILSRTSSAARLIAYDRDADAIDSGQALSDPRLRLVHASFSQVAAHLDELAIAEASGVLADLGVSSPQLDDPTRGFSFRLDGPLDMRMDHRADETAESLLARLPESELADLIYYYGEERNARRIARAIVLKRSEAPISTTRELVSIIESATTRRDHSKHPATRTFQALRIAVNQELEELEQLLEDIPSKLSVGGRLVIISFHSLEDRLIKRRFRQLTRCDERQGFTFREPMKSITPTSSEQRDNRRARSARLRVLERSA